MKHRKELLWTVLPFLIGLGALFLIPAPYLSQIIIVPFWFWAGKTFAGLDMSKLRSFAFGNSVWGICFIIFIWQFLLESAPHRIKALEVISLSYISPFYIITHALPPIGAYFSGLRFTSTVIILTLLGYVIMLVIFTLGFIWGRLRLQPTSSTTGI